MTSTQRYQISWHFNGFGLTNESD